MSGLLLTSTLISFCGKTSICAASSDSGLPDLTMAASSCDGRQDAVAGRVVVEEDDVAGVLAAQHAAQALHVLEHVAVADLGGVVLEAVLLAGHAQTQVAHHGADQQVVLQPALLLSMRPQMSRIWSPVISWPFSSTAIRRSPSPSKASPTAAPSRPRPLAQVLGVLRAALVVDVEAVGRVVDARSHRRPARRTSPERPCRWPRWPVSRTIFIPSSDRSRGEGVFQEDDVAPVHVVQAEGPAHVARRRHASAAACRPRMSSSIPLLLLVGELDSRCRRKS